MTSTIRTQAVRALAGSAVIAAAALGAATASAASSSERAIKNEYTRVALAEFFGPARAVCSQLTGPGVHAYTGGHVSCAAMFATNQRALRLKATATRWPAIVESTVSRLEITIRGNHATAVDPSRVFHRAQLAKVRGSWKFTSAPPTP
jgi:hypothetical protein